MLLRISGRFLSCLPLLLIGMAAAVADAPAPVSRAERSFLDFMDAADAARLVESGAQSDFQGRDLPAWRALRDQRRAALDRDLSTAESAHLPRAEARAIAAMRRSLAELEADEVPQGGPEPACRDAQRRDLDYAGMRAALVACYTEYGNRLQFADRNIDRGTALQLLHVVEAPEQRKALFAAFQPLWVALNGHDEPDSPYRRMIAQAAADAARHGSGIDAAARAVGVDPAQVERWLVQVLEAWRDATSPAIVEPWDYRYVGGEANRLLARRIPAEALAPANSRYFEDLGADPAKLGVLFDLVPRADKSPLAYTDFVSRGRQVGPVWQPPRARVLGSYPTGGLFSLNELVHETGHAVHVSAIHARPAYMDWPDTLFTEAFADVPSWSVYEPAWQRRYLGGSASEAASLRALFSDVMLDVAWSLFELRLLRDPQADPNAVWTAITREYLHVAPHPEMPWWAMRVQLAGNPGYMVNYGLGAVLTAAMRERVAQAIGPFDAGNARWYDWLSQRLLRFGAERDTRDLLADLLRHPLTPDALLRQLRRCSPATDH